VDKTKFDSEPTREANVAARTGCASPPDLHLRLHLESRPGARFWCCHQAFPRATRRPAVRISP